MLIFDLKKQESAFHLQTMLPFKPVSPQRLPTLLNRRKGFTVDVDLLDALGEPWTDSEAPVFWGARKGRSFLQRGSIQIWFNHIQYALLGKPFAVELNKTIVLIQT